jgi:hypothetical protein
LIFKIMTKEGAKGAYRNGEEGRTDSGDGAMGPPADLSAAYRQILGQAMSGAAALAGMDLVDRISKRGAEALDDPEVRNYTQDLPVLRQMAERHGVDVDEAIHQMVPALGQGTVPECRQLSPREGGEGAESYAEPEEPGQAHNIEVVEKPSAIAKPDDSKVVGVNGQWGKAIPNDRDELYMGAVVQSYVGIEKVPAVRVKALVSKLTTEVQEKKAPIDGAGRPYRRGVIVDDLEQMHTFLEPYLIELIEETKTNPGRRGRKPVSRNEKKDREGDCWGTIEQKEQGIIQLGDVVRSHSALSRIKPYQHGGVLRGVNVFLKERATVPASVATQYKHGWRVHDLEVFKDLIESQIEEEIELIALGKKKTKLAEPEENSNSRGDKKEPKAKASQSDLIPEPLSDPLPDPKSSSAEEEEETHETEERPNLGRSLFDVVSDLAERKPSDAYTLLEVQLEIGQQNQLKDHIGYDSREGAHIPHVLEGHQEAVLRLLLPWLTDEKYIGEVAVTEETKDVSSPIMISEEKILDDIESDMEFFLNHLEILGDGESRGDGKTVYPADKVRAFMQKWNDRDEEKSENNERGFGNLSEVEWPE